MEERILMDSELKAKWVEALRSGKYKQGKDKLRTIDDRFCCLGTLCDVIDSSKWVKELNCLGIEYWVYRIGEDPSEFNSSLLPFKMENELGLESHVGRLVADNDAGVSFEHIAKYIEKNV